MRREGLAGTRQRRSSTGMLPGSMRRCITGHHGPAAVALTRRSVGAQPPRLGAVSPPRRRPARPVRSGELTRSKMVHHAARRPHHPPAAAAAATRLHSSHGIISSSTGLHYAGHPPPAACCSPPGNSGASDSASPLLRAISGAPGGGRSSPGTCAASTAAAASDRSAACATSACRSVRACVYYVYVIARGVATKKPEQCATRASSSMRSGVCTFRQRLGPQQWLGAQQDPSQPQPGWLGPSHRQKYRPGAWRAWLRSRARTDAPARCAAAPRRAPL